MIKEIDLLNGHRFCRIFFKSLVIEVCDHGYGIPSADLERVFEKFYRVPRVQDAGTPGTGLGLALVREIAELHRGTVAVRSEVNQGSTFT